MRASTGRQTRLIISLATALLFNGASAAETEDQRGTVEEREACTPDVFRLCSSYIPNADRISVCLKEHLQSLSEPCRVVMSNRDSAKKKPGLN
jgi:hypothetical protein